jgi:RNA recognition motif-containing protein
MPKKIRVGGMPPYIGVTDMNAAFNSYGTIVASSIDLDAAGQSLGVGHIEYTTDQSGTNAIAGMNGGTLGGATIRVTDDT